MRSLETKIRNAPISTLQWFVAIYCLFAGAVLLITPHLVSRPVEGSVDDFRAFEGVLLLLGGCAMAAGALIALPRWLWEAAHVVAGLVLCARAVGLESAYGGFYGPSAGHLVLGLATIAAPFCATRLLARSRQDYLSYAAAAFLAVNAQYVNSVPPGLARALPPLPYGIGILLAACFLLTGTGLAFTETFTPARRIPYRISRITAGILLMAWSIRAALIASWLGLALWAGLGAVVASSPWLRPALGRLDQRSLRFRLSLGLATLGAVPLICLAMLFAFSLDGTAKDQESRLQETVAAAISHDVENFISLHRAAVVNMAGEPGLLDRKPEQQREYLERIARAYPEVTAFTLSDASGRNRARSVGLPLTSIADQQFFRDTRDMNQSRTVFLKGTLPPGFFVVLTAPMHDKFGAFSGLITAGIQTARLNEVVARTTGRIGGTAYIADDDRRIVVHPDPAQFAAPAKALESMKRNGSAVYTAADGEHFASFAHMDRLPLTVIVDRQESIVLAGLHEQRNLTLAGLLGGSVLATLLGSLAARRFSRPLHLLTEATTLLADGNNAAPTARVGITELDDIRLALERTRERLRRHTEERDRAVAALQLYNEDLETRVQQRTGDLREANDSLRNEIERRRTTESQLREAKDMLEALINSSPLPIIGMDASGSVMRWNPAAHTVFGWTAQEAIGRFNPTVPADQLREYSHLLRGVSTGAFIVDYETQSLTAAGRRIDVSLSLAGLHADTFTGYFSIVSDITERRQNALRIVELNHALDRRLQQLDAAVEEKSLLLREVQHRVKNNLQVISSLASMQARQAGHDAIREAMLVMQNRVKSMSLIHESLCFSGDLAEIDFDRYVRDLAPRLVQSYRPDPSDIQLHFDIDAVLRLDEATPCGLIVNELLSNCLKHAFPRSGSGAIWIGFKQYGGEFAMEFRDNGAGMPEGFSLQTTESLGLQVVTDLCAQLGGSLTWRNDGGAAFRLNFRRKGEKTLGASV